LLTYLTCRADKGLPGTRAWERAEKDRQLAINRHSAHDLRSECNGLVTTVIHFQQRADRFGQAFLALWP
jgi:hypothetical protein